MHRYPKTAWFCVSLSFHRSMPINLHHRYSTRTIDSSYRHTEHLIFFSALVSCVVHVFVCVCVCILNRIQVIEFQCIECCRTFWSAVLVNASLFLSLHSLALHIHTNYLALFLCVLQEEESQMPINKQCTNQMLEHWLKLCLLLVLLWHSQLIYRRRVALNYANDKYVKWLCLQRYWFLLLAFILCVSLEEVFFKWKFHFPTEP